MVFHESYLYLLTQLLPSLIKAGWNQLTTRKKNLLSESEASSICPIVEAFLKHEVDRYQRNKKSCYNPTIEVETETHWSYSEEEVNAKIKEATDNLCQEFIKSTKETLKTIKQQKDIECNQIKIDMANWKEKDSKSYSNISWKK
ncbi:hypothetical protein C2G38_2208382 [Gigaspora rosea]|uniref:Uncharacterized protein n=1 Tax=Gigaspora rosea TaxID=44941 RepID=A0A397UHN4_9GLOM|nr:hypothetical protein C2G38_2208382 [Gigaspora rosea]